MILITTVQGPFEGRHTFALSIDIKTHFALCLCCSQALKSGFLTISLGPYDLLGSLYLACIDKNAFFTSEQHKRYKLWSCQKMCDALHYLLDNIFIRFGSKLYRQIVGIPMGTNCAPLVADSFLFCYERDFMLSLSDNNQADIIEAFNSTSRYLDDLLNIDNPYFEQMVGQIYPTELHVVK